MVEDVLRAGSTEAEPSTRRPLRRPWWSRFSRAHALAAVTALVAGALNLAALRGGDTGTEVLVAAGDLAAGAALEDVVVSTRRLAAEAEVLRTLIPADRLEQRVGWLLGRPLRAGEPLRWTDLRDPAAPHGLRAMSVPVEPEHAVAGVLRAGDRVDVIAVREGQAFWVAADVEVLGVEDRLDGDGLGASSPYALTLAVTEPQALRLAWALHDGAVEIVRATGAPPLQEAAAVQGGPAAASPADESEEGQ